MRAIVLVMLCLCGLLWQGAAVSDEWAPPTSETYYSANRLWRLTVIPRAIESPLAYFRDKAQGKSNAGAPSRDPEQSARGLFERRSGKTWELVWNRPLANEVGPVSASVSNQGMIATFDNWHSMGYGKNVVVLYDRSGRKIRSMALDDILPKTYIEALPHSVSSIWWGGDHHFSSDGKQLTLRVVVPFDQSGASSEQERNYVDIAIDSATGRVLRPRGPAWNHAMQIAASVDAKQRAAKAAEIAFHNSPLKAPATDDVTPWYRYLIEAFFRMDPGRQDGWPATTVLPRRGDPTYARLFGYLKDALVDPLDDSGAIMLASPDQTNLVHAIDQVTSKLPQNRLPKARIYVTVTPALRKLAAKAIERTGATFVPLDVTKPIPVPLRPSHGDSGSH
jgi:hypothetical protein